MLVLADIFLYPSFPSPKEAGNWEARPEKDVQAPLICLTIAAVVRSLGWRKRAPPEVGSEGMCMLAAPTPQIQTWPIERLVEYPRNPAQERRSRRSHVRIDPRIRIQDSVLARSDGEIVDGHLRLKAARKLGHHRDPSDSLRRMDSGAS